MASNQIKSTILNHSEFQAFAKSSLEPFTSWFDRASLDAVQIGDSPKAIIQRISEDLLASYAEAPLLSKYDIYQILMDYWAEVMLDDVFVLAQVGWGEGNQLRSLKVAKGEKLKEEPDLVINKNKYKAELIPPALLVSRYFADKQTKVDDQQSQLDAATQELESYLEENSGEDGLLNDALNDKDQVTKATVTARLKAATDLEEMSALRQTKKLFEAESDAKKVLKEAQDALDQSVFKKYPTLIESDVKTLLVEDKWKATLQANIQAEIERVTQQLANRVKELDERYAEPLPEIRQSVDELSGRVAEHLKAMGLEGVL